MFGVYRRRSQAGGIDREDDARIPRAASASCYIDRRTCGRVPSANTPRSLDKDIATGSKARRRTRPSAVSSANMLAPASFRPSTEKT